MSDNPDAAGVPGPIAMQDIELVLLDLPELHRLATSTLELPAPEGALPPAQVAARALSQWEGGVPAQWCVPFLIRSRATGAILGGCRFKGAPVEGSVEIGYGVAQAARRRGVASAAVAHLLALAASSGQVRQVVAHIVPDNAASAGVVSRLGFSATGTVVDPDGEQVVRWVRALTVAGSTGDAPGCATRPAAGAP